MNDVNEKLILFLIDNNILALSPLSTRRDMWVISARSKLELVWWKQHENNSRQITTKIHASKAQLSEKKTVKTQTTSFLFFTARKNNKSEITRKKLKTRRRRSQYKRGAIKRKKKWQFQDSEETHEQREDERRDFDREVAWRHSLVPCLNCFKFI